MAKATSTIRSALHYQPQYAEVFAANQALFNCVVAFYFECIQAHEGILVFEHLGNLQPEKGKYSRRGNTKRAYWMKGRIFRYSKYKAWNASGIITSRVNPRNTSLKIGQRLLERYSEPFKEKPHTAVRRAGRVSKETGVALSQDAKRQKGPSISEARHGERNVHGTAQQGTLWMDERP